MQTIAKTKKVANLLYFFWHRFVEDKCFEVAGSLSYTTILSIVPVAAITFGIVAAMPVFQQWQPAITGFLFTNFFPSSAQAVQNYLNEFAANANSLRSFGAVGLVISVLLMMANIEDAFNRIWRVPNARRWWKRLLIYLVVLAVGPILMCLSLSVGSTVLHFPAFVSVSAKFPTVMSLLGLLPTVLTFLVLFICYWLIPNTKVRAWHATIGAFFTTALFEMVKYGFAWFLANATYEQLYGALAVFPILLTWIYISWSIVLLGASGLASMAYLSAAMHEILHGNKRSSHA